MLPSSHRLSDSETVRVLCQPGSSSSNERGNAQFALATGNHILQMWSRIPNMTARNKAGWRAPLMGATCTPALGTMHWQAIILAAACDIAVHSLPVRSTIACTARLRQIWRPLSVLMLRHLGVARAVRPTLSTWQPPDQSLTVFA